MTQFGAEVGPQFAVVVTLQVLLNFPTGSSTWRVAATVEPGFPPTQKSIALGQQLPRLQSQSATVT